MEQALTLKQTAERLGIRRTTLYKHKAKLEANGLQSLKLEQKVLYRAAAVDALIAKAFETERPFWEVAINKSDIERVRNAGN